MDTISSSPAPRRDPSPTGGSGPTHLRATRERAWWALGGFVAALLIGFAYAAAVRAAGDWNVGLDWELALMRRVDHELPHSIDWLFLTVPWTATNITLAPFTYAACLWLWLRRKRGDLAMHLGVVQTGSFILNFAMKSMFDRARPELWEKRGQWAWASYPSGHAIASFAVLFTIAYLLERERGWRWPYVVLGLTAAITLWSRLYLGVHWPTDVIGGGIVGLVWLGTTLVAFSRPARRRATP